MGSSQSRIDEFNELTNNGTIFDRDLSKRTDLGVRRDGRNEELVLTDDEVRDRDEWIKLKEVKLGPKWDDEAPISVRIASLFFNQWSNKGEDLLNMQVAAPMLDPDSRTVSKRSAVVGEHRANRWHPPTLSEWPGFLTMVDKFTSDLVMNNERKKTKAWKSLRSSFTRTEYLGDEIGEQHYLQFTAMNGLQSAGFIGKFVAGNCNRGIVGSPDFTIRDDQNRIIVVGEAKSTHNLLLSMKARDIVKQYNDAVASLNHSAGPTVDHIRGWSHVGHPLAQLIGYLKLNECRYGLLTSGTRTYFVYIKQESGGDVVQISDAWFIGQPNYLRAVATMYNFAQTNFNHKFSKKNRLGWRINTPKVTKTARDKKRARKGDDPGRVGPQTRRRTQGSSTHRGRGGRRTGGQADAEVQALEFPFISLDDLCIEVVDFEDIEIKKPIGYGRRGTSFSAQWKKEEVALKVFDATKPGGQEAFVNEVKAYIHLKDAWGKLVPKPRFVSNAFGILFLGMQMAQDPPPDADVSDWGDVVDKLETKYKFRHLDVFTGERGSEWQNLMTVHDKKGGYHAVVIDLEDYKIID